MSLKVVQVELISQNHRMFRVGRDLCGSSSPTALPKQGHLEQALPCILLSSVRQKFVISICIAYLTGHAQR